MSKSLNFGLTPTPFTPVGGLSQYGSVKTDYAKLADGSMVYVGTNVHSPVDRPFTVRRQTTKVADVYKGSQVNPAYVGPSKEGFSTVIQINAIASVTDSEDASYRVDLPVQVHLVVKAPNHGLLGGAELQPLVAGLLCYASAGHLDGSEATLLDSLIRGAVTPSTSDI